MKTVIIKIISTYQRFFSKDTGVLSPRRSVCVFYPTCSQYTKEAIEKYGVIKGFFCGAVRILRCVPWQKQTNDPLP